ncbi:MAG: pectinesterase family protein, partial [Sedimentisphaerales bacterium]|nr:pectinesterase family protein [Sedimentisphaerales bacterium]
KASAPAADHDYMVALDGSGDFCTLQGAVDAVVDNDPCRTLIKVKKGTYRELVHIPINKTNVTWLGEDRDTTIMAAYNCENFAISPGSDNRMMLRCYANGFRMYNMTFHNLTPDGGTQAETIKHSGQQSIVNNCKFMSFQDTLCLNGQMYLKDCYIEGDTDYIWGYGTVYFNTCRMHSVSTKSYVTQPRTADGTNGFFFVDCNLTCPTGLTGCYLGRMTGTSLYPYAQSVYINCTMPKTLFLPVGWKPIAGEDLSYRRWWEYKSVEPNGTLIDVSQRLNPGSRQLTDAEAVTWRDVNNVFGTWNPKVLDLPTASWLP